MAPRGPTDGAAAPTAQRQGASTGGRGNGHGGVPGRGARGGDRQPSAGGPHTVNTQTRRYVSQDPSAHVDNVLHYALILTM